MQRDHVISLIQAANQASIGVAERIGEKLEGRMELYGREVLIYRIDREAWRASQNSTGSAAAVHRV